MLPFTILETSTAVNIYVQYRKYAKFCPTIVNMSKVTHVTILSYIECNT
jgi:hypothetical protein